MYKLQKTVTATGVPLGTPVAVTVYAYWGGCPFLGIGIFGQPLGHKVITCT